MIQRILVPLDGSAIAEQALPHAATLARAFDASLVLARVPEPLLVPVMSAGVWITRSVESEEAHEDAAAYLNEVRGRDELAGIAIETMHPTHPVVHGLLDAIAVQRADMLVMTSHGHTGPDRWIFGSVADKLVHVAPVPAYVVRARRPSDAGETAADADAGAPAAPISAVGGIAIRKIIVPLDGSALAEQALPAAETLGRRTGATLVLVRIPVVPGYLTVVPETAGWIPEQLAESAHEAETYLESRAAEIRERGLDVDVEVRVVMGGTVADGILAEAEQEEAEVIVISSHGRSGLGRWLFGSVANRVLRGARCAVWVIREGTSSV